MGIWNSVKEKVDGLEERRQNWVENQLDFDEERVESIIRNAAGDSVNRDTLLIPIEGWTTPYNLLDDGEQPHYFLNGSTVDVEGQGAGTETIIGWDRDRRIGSVYTVITEKRVLVIANHPRGYDEHTIPYDAIANVNLNSGLTSTRLSIHTKSATYHCSISKSKRKYGDDEQNNAVEYLRKICQQGVEPTLTDDSLNRLEKLKSLYDDDALTDEEFEEKKAEILDDI